jgi:protein SCO1/2
VKVHDRLGDRVGRQVVMLSVTIDAEHDTPAVLRAYDEAYGGPRRGWLYLTGDDAEIEALRRSMGVYDLDPVVDADPASHSGILTFGNDRTDRWAALPALMESETIVEAVLRITRDRRVLPAE